MRQLGNQELENRAHVWLYNEIVIQRYHMLFFLLLFLLILFQIGLHFCSNSLMREITVVVLSNTRSNVNRQESLALQYLRTGTLEMMI